MSRREDKAILRQIMDAALEAVDPERAILRHMHVDDGVLHVADRRYDLDEFRRIFVIGGGKAGAPMARAVESLLGERITGGHVNVRYGYSAPTSRITIHQAGHPIPDEAGVTGTDKIIRLAESAGEDDMVIVLISGGGSALMVHPVEGVSLRDIQTTTDTLLRCGAAIGELNAIRKHLSRIKGGQLARAAYPATVIAPILSDVVGSPLDVIASGPTAPDPTTFADAWSVIERYRLADSLPESVVHHIRAGMKGIIPETPKPDDPVFEHVQNVIVAENSHAAHAALEHGHEMGFNTMLLSTYVEGEAREIGKVMAAIARQIAESGHPLGQPALIIAGGETTVTVRGNGRGGRNQELALAAAIHLAGVEGATIATLATDGTDGPTDAAGAFAFGDTVRRALASGLDPAGYLADNNSYEFFQDLGDLLITGPTGTNVNDLTFIMVR